MGPRSLALGITSIGLSLVLGTSDAIAQVPPAPTPPAQDQPDPGKALPPTDGKPVPPAKGKPLKGKPPTAGPAGNGSTTHEAKKGGTSKADASKGASKADVDKPKGDSVKKGDDVPTKDEGSQNTAKPDAAVLDTSSKSAPAGASATKDAKSEVPGADDPPRPPPFKDEPPRATLPPKRRLDVGAEFLLVNRLAADQISGRPSHIAYHPAGGFEFHARVQVFRYLQVSAYFAGSAHTIQLGPGALGVSGSIDSTDLSTIWFGGKIMPTLPLGERVRLWTTAGVAWGRYEYPQMKAHEHGREPFLIKGRGNSFVEFPIGLGASFEMVKNWLSFDVELTGSPMLHNDGDSFVTVQELDNGHQRTVDPLPKTHVNFVQGIGLSLLL